MHARLDADMDGAPMAGGRWWGGPTPAVAASTDVMNQLCRVCGEPAAGFHFGAFTCEGCKSFFGRTYNNLSSISECKNNGCCVINKKNRTSCKACRLRKCLMVGMSKSGSRYGRRSNWFKIHCLLQEQQQQSQHHQPQQQAQNKSPTWEGLHNVRAHYKPVEDNNNHVPKRITVMSQPTMGIPPNFPHPNEAAAFWAARSSLIAGSHPPSLAMPFLGSPFYQPPRHFLMPFMQTTIPVPPTPMSSSSSSSSSCVSEGAGEEADRVLGPVQEQPIDLSVRSGGEVAVEETAEGSEHSESAPASDVEEEEGRKRSVTPLDLTTKV